MRNTLKNIKPIFSQENIVNFACAGTVSPDNNKRLCPITKKKREKLFVDKQELKKHALHEFI